jgi:uncharacterized damage-inducible protein DinB
MTKLHVSILALAVAVALTAVGARLPLAQTPKPIDKTPPSYDMKAQASLDLEDLQKKFVSLAKAIPPEQYSWRPAQGVRSIAEVYLHVAGTNFQYAAAIGATPPPGFAPKDFDKSTTDKAKIVDLLSKSFEDARGAVENMRNIDFRKPLPQFGPDANSGDIVYIIVAHSHEHLGQSIAYARMNGIVPPWTAAQQKGQQQE